MAGCNRAGGEPCPHDPPHGRYTTYFNHGCRCSECRAAASEYNRNRQPRPCSEQYGTCPHADAEHGRLSTYNHHGCRCERCREAHRRYARELRARRRARLARGDDGAVPHGTYQGYDGWGCRCRKCRLAGARMNRRMYVRRTREGEQGIR